MNKPKFETPNLTAENVAKIAELFPGVVAEGRVTKKGGKSSDVTAKNHDYVLLYAKSDGFTVRTYNDCDLIASFQERISEKAIREIAERKPLRAVFRDSGFTSSPEKINVFEIFKLLAPNTSVKVI